MAWRHLERLKSRLADIDEIENLFANRFGILVNDEQNPNADTPRMTIKNIAFDMSLEDLRKNNNVNNPQVVMNIIANELAVNGFTDVAEQLKTADSIPTARAILESAIQSCAVVRQFRSQEKELKSERSNLHTEESIFAWNRRLSALRGEHKTAMKTLYGARDYMNIPTILSAYIRQNINEIQKNFKRLDTTSVVAVSLDGRFNEQLDKDPGKISGDCAEGEPLPFLANVGAHNIKVSIESEYTGNIYLVDTKTKDDTRIWHLDAIQIPSGRINWAKFPATLKEQLAAKATEAGVDGITLHNQLASGRMPTAEVIFPKFGDYKEFQGDGDNQIFLWKKQDPATV